MTRVVPYGDGELAVRDHGGTGVDVLLVHALGMNSVNWDRTAALLSQTCHAWAIDLPGHGRSTASMRTYDDVWRWLPAVVEGLLLDTPLLVGHDQGSLCMVEAVATDPHLYRGGVAVGGTIAHTRQEMRELCDFAASDFFADQLRARFRLGERGHGQRAARELVEAVVSYSDQDWITYDLAGLAEETAYAIRYFDDSSWIRQPDPEAVAQVGRFPSDSPVFPVDTLAASYRVPVWIVQLSEGFDAQFADREAELVAAHDMLRLTRLECGQWPQYTAAPQLAALIARIAADPGADRMPFDPFGPGTTAGVGSGPSS